MPAFPTIASVRLWLKTNKVFFETIAASCLAAASIIVAVVQALIAGHQDTLINKQNALIDLQTRVTEAQAMPSFDIRIIQVQNPQTGKMDNHQLDIDNNGGPVHEFNADAIFTVKITATTDTAPMKQASMRLRVDDYYGVSFVTALSKGHLITKGGKNDNNRKLYVFSTALLRPPTPHNWWSANTDESTYLHLNYLDILNRRHAQYYLVEPVTGSQSLTVEEGRKDFEEARSLRHLSLDDLTFDKIAPDIDKQLKKL